MRLITSAFPHLHRPDENGVDVGEDLVGRCIRSWQGNGFDIVSVHNRAEEETIGAGLPGVAYHFVDEDVPEGTRALPTLAAVLADLPPDEPVGIINADVFMVPLAGFAAKLAAAAREATVLAHRWDVPSLSRREGRRFDVGVDLIAFTPRRIAPAIAAMVRRPYRLGIPWWDYALPLAASLYAPLRLIDDTLLLHHWHELAWNEPEWRGFAAITEEVLAEQARDPLANPERADALARRLEQLASDHADDTDRHIRDYALDDLARNLIHEISGEDRISLLADIRLLPPPPPAETPWWVLAKQELQRAKAEAAATAQAEAAAEAEAAALAAAALAADETTADEQPRADDGLAEPAPAEVVVADPIAADPVTAEIPAEAIPADEPVAEEPLVETPENDPVTDPVVDVSAEASEEVASDTPPIDSADPAAAPAPPTPSSRLDLLPEGSSAAAILVAAARDGGGLVQATIKRLERRFRHWRRGIGSEPPGA